jgi:hypothetical protein
MFAVMQVSRMPKQNGSRGRTVVITQGSSPTVVAVNGRVTLYPVIALPADKLVDTNGAGEGTNLRLFVPQCQYLAQQSLVTHKKAEARGVVSLRHRLWVQRAWCQSTAQSSMAHDVTGVGGPGSKPGSQTAGF